ncbi:MAG: chorismate-binding protein [Muribaculaceae bacterium]|nr:chorismate-binding protein [Muribaculaceae bacterium]
MGISFELGTRKATNGPMIFFSDPVSEVNLRDEIRGAIESRLCFYAYRMPGDMMVSFGSSEGVIEGFGKAGFVIAPFLPKDKIWTIPYAPTSRNKTQEQYPFPMMSTSYEDYANEIEIIKKFIGDSDNRKIVAARVQTDADKVDVASTFLSLLRAYPDAYVYCFSTPQTGCWIGATPELLLQKRASRLYSMALAGTRKADSQGEWDQKNIKEQQMVADYIERCMSESGLNVEKGETVTRRAGNIEHLCTPVEAESNAGFNSADKLLHLLHNLAPTPATAGVPREAALEIIKKSEKFQRAFYGGFCGPYRNAEEFTMFVILRCARIEAERYALFAGGGITSRSVPEHEWEETDMKLATLNNLLCFE